VSGYSGALSKTFREYDRAKEWLYKRTHPGATFEDDASDFDDDESGITQDWPDTLPATRRGPPTREISLPGITEEREPRGGVPMEPILSDIIDITKSGPDRSIGKPREIYETSINVESKVLKILCPKGVTSSVQQEVLSACPDIVTLPGKSSYGNGSVNEQLAVVDQLAQSFGEISDRTVRRHGQQPRDTQWRAVSRNNLGRLDTPTDLQQAAEELLSCGELVLSNMTSTFQEILFNAGWTANSAELWCRAGLLPHIIRRTLDLFSDLHQHLLTTHDLHSTQWDTVTGVRITFHAENLRRIRTFAQHRGQLILLNYIYLRDMRSKSWQDIKLLGQLMDSHWHQAEEQHTDTQGGRQKAEKVKKSGEDKSKKPDPKIECVHCMSHKHFGPVENFPVKELRRRKAIALAKRADPLFEDDPKIYAKLLKEAKDKE
jgi:hypothetical protein